MRVLLVDDSSLIRRLVSEVLSEDDDFDLVEPARNGREALERLSSTEVDAVVLDIEMPLMSGLEALPEIRRLAPKLPVIMFSTLTDRGASATLEALTRGATDYVNKPSNTGSIDESRRRIREELIPKLRMFGASAPASQAVPAAPVTQAMPVPMRRKPRPRGGIRVVGVGASTGGPNALAAVLAEVPATLPVAVLVVQHMPPVFTGLLAERLDRCSGLSFAEATDGMSIEPGHGYVAPGDHHMTIARDGTDLRIRLNQDAPEHSCRPAVDPLFRSLAQVHGGDVLGVVLTGMGRDGLAGVRCIKDAGGQVLAQDQETSVVWGMPGYVAAAGLADEVLPLEGMASEILHRVGFASPVLAG